MEKVFRSRGISYLKSPKDNQIIIKCKKYYEPETNMLLNYPEITCLAENDLLHIFEYSIENDEKIDSINFHVDLQKELSLLYSNISDKAYHFINKIPSIFSPNFRNYTVGYRLSDDRITGKSFYFYPTIWKKNRYGINGITDKSLINTYILNFIDYLKAPDAVASELLEYISITDKFKGICVSLLQGNKIEYKLYSRIKTDLIYSHTQKSMNIDYNCNNELGDVVLSCIRISDNKIMGYNHYYLY